MAAHFTVIKHFGIVLYGKPIEEVFGDVPKADYLDSIKSDIENAENEIVNDPVYLILNLCRVLAYMKDGIVVSKTDGGRWGLAHLPREYAALIQKALDCYSSAGEFNADGPALRDFARELKKLIFSL